MHLCHYPNCGKIYKKTSHLRAHLRWHIGDQPYLCSWPGCVRRFTRWPDPKRLDIGFDVLKPAFSTGRMNYIGTSEFIPGRGNISVDCVERVFHAVTTWKSTRWAITATTKVRFWEERIFSQGNVKGGGDGEGLGHLMDTDLDPTQMLEVSPSLFQSFIILWSELISRLSRLDPITMKTRCSQKPRMP